MGKLTIISVFSIAMLNHQRVYMEPYGILWNPIRQETRKTMEEMVGRGTGMVSVEIPFTPAAKRVLGDGVPWHNAL